MKNYFVIALLIFMFCGHEVYSYHENDHMYITYKAYQLLKLQGIVVPFYENRLGLQSSPSSEDFFLGKIITGSYREDFVDIVFKIDGPLGTGLYATNTHFWDADDRNNGDDTKTCLGPLINPCFFGRFPNAFTKAKFYRDGNWLNKDFTSPEYLRWNNRNGTFANIIYQNGLKNFYNNRVVWYQSYFDITGSEYYTGYNIQVSESVRDFMVAEILGRMCHLLQDMTIPAHAHGDIHPPDGSDHFETSVHNIISNYDEYTSGDFINPYNYQNQGDPLRYLFYVANQLADHFPSGPSTNQIEYQGDNYLPGGSNSLLTTYYNQLGPPPTSIDVYNNADWSVNHAIRATAGLLYWFAIEANLIPPPPIPPTFHSLTYNKTDLNLYQTTSSEPAGIFVCTAGGPNLSYDWTIKTCNKNINLCGDSIPGLQIIKNNNILTISNMGFRNSSDCPFYNSQFCGNDNMKKNENQNDLAEAIKLSISVTVSNSFGSITQDFMVNGIVKQIFPLQGVRPPPPPNGGCPFLFVYNSDSSKNLIDNNILHRSEISENIGLDIEDKYILKVNPGLINNKFSLGILEAENDHNYFDQIKMYAIDHSPWTKVLVTENNDIVLYNLIDVISTEEAVQNSSDVTEYMQFDTLANTWEDKTVSGISDDSIYASYDSQKIMIMNDKYRNQKNVMFGSENFIDSLAIITELGQNQSDIPIFHNVAKDYAGVMFIDANTDTFERYFCRREFTSPIVVPFSNNQDAVNDLNIKWIRDYKVEYLSVVNIQYYGFTQTELPLTSAFHSENGDILTNVQEKDQDYIELDSGAYLSFEFDNISPPPAGKIRDYVFITNGHYIVPGQMNARLFSDQIVNPKDKSSKNIFQNKLIGNYPNPFNPTTTINYEISNSSLVSIKIYDILGKEILSLINDFKSAGNYEVSFNASNLPSGVYYYKLISGDFTQIRKMLLLK